MQTMIDASKLKFAYVSEGGDYTFALNGVDIQVAQGEFVAILGRNGSGKSTFAKLVNALNLPTEGKMVVAGMDTTDEANLLDIRKTAGMVFQNPDNQLVATIVEEDIAFGPENLGLPREEIYDRIDYALSTVHMEAYRDHAPHMLSGGQKQRIAIAWVLAMKPKLIVFDESTAMLDPKGRQDILELIRQLNREEKITIVLITHYMDETVHADRLVVMKNGFVLREGKPQEIFFDRELLAQAGLIAPFAAQLSMDLAAAGIAVKPELDAETLAEEVCQLK